MNDKRIDEFVFDVLAMDDIEGLDGSMFCPDCGKPSLYCVDPEGNVELANGHAERTLRYYCDSCNLWFDVTQIYIPSGKRIKICRDVFDNDSYTDYRVEEIYDIEKDV